MAGFRYSNEAAAGRSFVPDLSRRDSPPRVARHSHGKRNSMQNDAKRFKNFVHTGSLTQEQENAIPFFLTGMSDQAVADRLKISRVTVNRWRNYHPLFIAELNRRRAALRQGAMDSLRSLVPRATASLRDQLVNGDGKLALSFLNRSGHFGTAATGPLLYSDIGPTDPQAVLDEEVRRRRADGRLPMPAMPVPLASPNAPSTAAGDPTTSAGAPAAVQP